MAKLISLFAVLIVLFSVTPLVYTAGVSAQGPTPTPNAPGSPQTLDLERRLLQLEAAQAQNIEALKTSNDTARIFAMLISAIIAVLVGIQGWTTYRQTRREGERDRTDNMGIQQVSRILGVVQQTLQTRLDTEKEERERAREAETRLKEVMDRFSALEEFYKSFQATINQQRRKLEDSADNLVKIPRHNFKSRAEDLARFADQLDQFVKQYGNLEPEPKPEFSQRVFYIRGIAAYFANDPCLSIENLNRAVSSQKPEPGESDLDPQRRAATAYYYLGSIEYYLGHNEKARKLLEKANQLDLERTDFQTRLWTAENHIMLNEFSEAERLIADVEEGLQRNEREHGQLRNHELRFKSRAALIRANIAIIARDENWVGRAKKLLLPVYDTEPQYYYATSTLAQLYAFEGDAETAKEVFRKVHEAIETSGDRFKMTEVRYKIHLYIIAGMCAKLGLQNEKAAEEYFNEALELRSSLPRLESDVYTVFSPHSRRDENGETIGKHIELIRKGCVLLQPD